MAMLAIGTGALLIVLGVGLYIAAGMASITAMIPAFFGLPILVFGIIARNERWRKHAMHGAVLFALLGLLGSVGMGYRRWPLLFQGLDERPLAAWGMLGMAIITAIFVALCVRSFIAARRTTAG